MCPFRMGRLSFYNWPMIIAEQWSLFVHIHQFQSYCSTFLSTSDAEMKPSSVSRFELSASAVRPNPQQKGVQSLSLLHSYKLNQVYECYCQCMTQ